MSDGMSGRDILGICKNVERRLTSALIRNETEDKVPAFDMYSEFISQRFQNLVD